MNEIQPVVTGAPLSLQQRAFRSAIFDSMLVFNMYSPPPTPTPASLSYFTPLIHYSVSFMAAFSRHKIRPSSHAAFVTPTKQDAALTSTLSHLSSIPSPRPRGRESSRNCRVSYSLHFLQTILAIGTSSSRPTRSPPSSSRHGRTRLTGDGDGRFVLKTPRIRVFRLIL